jgi:hypothetical protein
MQLILPFNLQTLYTHNHIINHVLNFDEIGIQANKQGAPVLIKHG